MLSSNTYYTLLHSKQPGTRKRDNTIHIHEHTVHIRTCIIMMNAHCPYVCVCVCARKIRSSKDDL